MNTPDSKEGGMTPPQALREASHEVAASTLAEPVAQQVLDATREWQRVVNELRTENEGLTRQNAVLRAAVDAHEAADRRWSTALREANATISRPRTAAEERAELKYWEDEADALRAALADADILMEEREQQLTEALEAVADERARCATVCREVADGYDDGEARNVVARKCAEAIERGEVGR